MGSKPQLLWRGHVLLEARPSGKRRKPMYILWTALKDEYPCKPGEGAPEQKME